MGFFAFYFYFLFECNKFVFIINDTLALIRSPYIDKLFNKKEQTKKENKNLLVVVLRVDVVVGVVSCRRQIEELVLGDGIIYEIK